MSTPIITESTAQAGTSKADLIRDTRCMVVALDSSTRQIADNLAALRDRHSMSQREIAAEIRKSAAWVNRILAWRQAGFPEDTPFGGTERREKESVQRAEQRAAKAAPPIKIGTELVKSLDGFSENAKRQIVAAVAGNGEDPQASAERMKEVHATAETPKSDTSAPKSVSGDTQQIKKGSAEWLFSEAAFFYKATLSKMDDTTFERAMEMFRARRAERCLKVAA